MSDINSANYHDYVIKDGQLIGEFEQMYKKCTNPWPETESDIENLATSARAAMLIANSTAKSVYSLGCGKGLHLNWLSKQCPGVHFSGCDISPTAIDHCKRTHPHLDVEVLDVAAFMKSNIEFDILVVREVIWYFLDQWDDFCQSLRRKYQKRHIIIELSFYDNQKYGNEFFDGPNQFIEKFPFTIKEIVRFHTSKTQREGMILVFAEI